MKKGTIKGNHGYEVVVNKTLLDGSQQHCSAGECDRITVLVPF